MDEVTTDTGIGIQKVVSHQVNLRRKSTESISELLTELRLYDLKALQSELFIVICVLDSLFIQRFYYILMKLINQNKNKEIRVIKKGKLFTDFPSVTTEQWMEKVTEDLKGADFQKKTGLENK